MYKVCSSLGQKWGNERAITGNKIILTCPLSEMKANVWEGRNESDWSIFPDCRFTGVEFTSVFYKVSKKRLSLLNCNWKYDPESPVQMCN